MTLTVREFEPRAGGSFNSVMRMPDGQVFANNGVFLEVIPNRRLVTTDAFTPGWRPAGKPFMVATLDLEDLGDGKTRYTARAMHCNAEDRETHEKMGFYEGWGQCADQLAALLARM